MARPVKKQPNNKKQDGDPELPKLQKDLTTNTDNIKQLLGNPADLVIRKIPVRGTAHMAAVVYIDGLVNDDAVYSSVVKNVQLVTSRKELPDTPETIFEELYQEIISVTDIKKSSSVDQLVDELLYGQTILYLDGVDEVFIMDTRGWEMRAIEEPSSETLIRGPRDGFVENLQTNTSLVRRYVRDQGLRFDTYTVGRRSKSNLVIGYIDGIIHPDLIKEVKRRVETIDMDDALESGFVEQWVEDSFLSPFPQMTNTERPDKVAAALTAGKCVLMLDGTPFVLIAPAVLGNAFESPEDYYQRWTIGTLIRVLRYVAAFIAVFLPGMYIALVAYQPGMIPSRLAFSIAATREGVPFPAFVEATLMVTTMELLREAGARLPTTIGQTIGIVGGLVIGEAAVQAGIVSPVMVIVVALNAIASFSIPQYSVAISFRILLYGIMVISAIFGIYGLILGYIMINIHIVNLKSMGVPYSTPFAPTFRRDMDKIVLRLSVPTLTRRPGYLLPQDPVSVDKGGQKK